MIKVTTWVGLLLVVLGFASFMLTGSQSFTALIPSVFGLLLLICAIIGREENRRKMAMHVAQGLTLLGLIGSVSGLIKVVMYLVGSGEITMPAAAIAQSIMALICLFYLILGIRTFINARKSAD